MSSCRDAAIEGWNTYLTDLQADEDGETWLTVLGFDDRREIWVDGAPVREVLPLGVETFVPRGMTALYDSIAHAIGLAEATLKKLKRPDMKVLIPIVTDGFENASTEYAGEAGRLALLSLVESYEAAGNFTFVYLSADVSQPASVAAAAVGISPGNAGAMGPMGATGSSGAVGAYSALSATTSSLRTNSAQSTDSAFADAGIGNDQEDWAVRYKDADAQTSREGKAK